MEQDNHSQPEDIPNPKIEGMLTGTELTIANTLLKLGVPIGQAAVKALKGEQPLSVQIDASWRESDYYYIAISFSNLTEHGIYIEELIMIDPDRLPIYVKTSKETNLMNREVDWIEAKEVFPVLLMTGDTPVQKFIIQISNYPTAGVSTHPDYDLSRRNTITLKYVYSRLDKDKPESKEKNIRIRQSGPASKIKGSDTRI